MKQQQQSEINKNENHLPRKDDTENTAEILDETKKNTSNFTQKPSSEHSQSRNSLLASLDRQVQGLSGDLPNSRDNSEGNPTIRVEEEEQQHQQNQESVSVSVLSRNNNNNNSTGQIQRGYRRQQTSNSSGGMWQRGKAAPPPPKPEEDLQGYEPKKSENGWTREKHAASIATHMDEVNKQCNVILNKVCTMLFMRCVAT